MEKLLRTGNEFLQQSTWEDLAVIKLCLWAMGILWGMTIPKQSRKPVALVTVIVFIATYIPLMFKFFKMMKEQDLKEI